MATRIPPHRKLFYAGVVTVGLFGLLNASVGLLERFGVLDTRRVDDMIHHVDGALFQIEEGHWVTTDYAEQTMLPLRLPVEKSEDVFRLIVIGGSFAMGTPYVHQGHGEERPGGISSWLRVALRARYSEADIQVLNLAAGGQSSHRVQQILAEAVQLEPDAVLVASCNNEGSMTPNRLEEELRRSAGVRFLSKLLKPEVARAERPLYTPQDMDSTRLRDEFKRNISNMVAVASQHDVPLFLSTLPVNLLYSGMNPGRILDRGGTHTPLRIVSNECRGSDCAYDTLETCSIEAGRALAAGELERAESILDGCDDLEALRLRGLLHYKREAYEDARQTLEQYTELVPRTRCRPSLNTILRGTAEARSGVHLVDMQSAAAQTSVSGISDELLFVDYCHMSWVGYALMADVALEAMEDAGIRPPGPRASDVPDTWAHAVALGLPDVPRTEWIGGPVSAAAAAPDRIPAPWAPQLERRERVLNERLPSGDEHREASEGYENERPGRPPGG